MSRRKFRIVSRASVGFLLTSSIVGCKDRSDDLSTNAFAFSFETTAAFLGLFFCPKHFILVDSLRLLD